MAGSNFADSNRAGLLILAEDPNNWGVTPATGSPRSMRITGSKLAYKKDTKTSDELRSDRMIPNIIEVGAMSNGNIDGEFSAGSMDDILAAFVYGLWSRPMTMDFWAGISVSIGSTSTVLVAGKDLTPYLVVGRRIKLEGFRADATNNYFQIASVVFASNTTTITVTEAVLTVESGSVFTKIADANDVIIMKNTAIRFGTAGASTIDSNGGNAFTAAAAAGQIKVGQKIHIDGLGSEAGTITFTGVPVAGDRIAISDGVAVANFQYGGSLPSGYISVLPGATVTDAATNLVAAIKTARINGALNVKATNVAGVVTLKNLELSGGSIVDTEAGALITVVNFAGGLNSIRGVFTVTSVANDVIGVTPQPATSANAGLAPITIKGSMLRNPSVVTDFVRQSFTVETSFEDVSQNFIARGLRVGSFDLDIKSGEIVTFSSEFMGTGMVRAVDQLSVLRKAPYTPLESTANEIMNATTNVGDLSKNGSALSTGIQSISIKGDASLREQKAVGSKFPRGIGVGRFKLSGSFSAYFQTGELFDDFVSHATVSLSWFFKDIAGIRYDVTLPAIKLTSDPIAPEKIDEDIIENIDWEAQRDPATNCMIQFDRFSSTKAPTA
ncbi:MAG: phage tail tube protein [Sediminibacterium sp.]